jgi:SNF2 family DNA or RNA helicase/uncharacterized Zn finger protein
MYRTLEDDLMAGKYIFGLTWWGKEWVKAIEKIDIDENRLPRGRSYAKNGNVLKIELNGEQIRARVQGSRPTPYHESMTLKVFGEREKEIIKSIIEERPDLASQIFVGQLPPELNELLVKNGVHLFPVSWDEIDARCSCPDWANPCKHLAAVYYIIASEIDKDPFLLFEMRGISKAWMMKIAGLKQSSSLSGKYVFIDEDQVLDPENIEEVRPTLENESFLKMLDLLDDNPLFFKSQNFKEKLKDVYNDLLGYENVSLEGTNDKENVYLKDTTFKILFSSKTSLVIYTGGDIKIEKKRKMIPLTVERKRKKKSDKITIEPVATGYDEESNFKVIKFSEMYDFFENISMIVDEKDSPYSAFFKKVFSFARRLVSKGLIMPEASMINEKGDFKVDFVPFFSQTKYVNYLSSIAPKDVVINDDGKVLRRDMIGTYVLTLTINEMIKKRFDYLEVLKDKLISTFFLGEIYKAENFEEKHTFAAISNWLSVLNVRGGEYTLVVGITRKEKGFDMRLFVEKESDPFELPIEFDHFLKMDGIEDARTRIFKQLGIISKYSPLVAKASKNGRIKGLEIEDLKEFITSGQYVLSSLGVKILLPKELKKIWKPELRLTALVKNKKDHIRSYLNLDDIFEFKWKIQIGDRELSPEELLNLYDRSKGIVALKDRYVFIDPDEMSAIIQKVKTNPLPSSGAEAFRDLLSGERDGMKIEFDKNLEEFLESFKKLSSIRPPKSLNGTLREYQIRGFQWLYSNMEKGFGVCLADDMGLGKTVQVISVILKKIEMGKLDRPALVICPTTLIGNWKSEIEKFAPSVKVAVYHGPDRVLDVDSNDMVITSYGVVRSDLKRLKSIKWSSIIIDEAQNIKNSETLQSLSVKAIKADSKVALTGTPVENRLTELWSIYDFLMPDYLGKKEWFIKSYSIPIEKDGDADRIDELKRIVSPFMMRRMKTDKNIIKDLPDKIIMDDHVELKMEQASLYKQVAENEMKKLYEANDEVSRNGAIFRIITSLKQICNHPVHYEKRGEPKIESSGKAERTVEILRDILDVNQKAVIFTQYKEMGELLVKMISAEFGIEPLFFHGELSRGKRDSMVNEFQTKHSKPFMILTIKAGGTGLNLTAANHVIHYDLWWNPAVEDQGTDRTFRIGQSKNVIVHRLITTGTLEEKINRMLKEKRKISTSVITAEEKWIGNLSNDELKELFKLD